MLRYAITNRALYSGDAPQQQASLLRQASRWAADGIDLIQLREKDLPAATLADLAGAILQAIAQNCRAHEAADQLPPRHRYRDPRPRRPSHGSRRAS